MKKEQEVIGLIITCRKNGYSYLKIADILNQRDISTKTSSGSWYPKVVRGIYLNSSYLQK